jgi:hypothetical protein
MTHNIVIVVFAMIGAVFSGFVLGTIIGDIFLKYRRWIKK